MPWRNIFIVVMIAVLLAAYGLLTRRNSDELTQTSVPVQSGYYLQQATVTETDATGAQRFKLHANTITQNPRDQSIELQQVTLDYHSAPDAAWLLTANSGHLASGSRTINFMGAVEIKPQPGAPSQQPLELHTEVLSVDTLNNIATAPGRVNMAMDKQQLIATGLKYDLKRQTLRLESQLHGQFHPQPHQ